MSAIDATLKATKDLLAIASNAQVLNENYIIRKQLGNDEKHFNLFTLV